MEMQRLVAPGLVLIGTAILLAPAETRAFTVFGDVLDLTQRDFRIRNSFTGPWANTNQTPNPDFPGSLGAELAIRKGVSEWGSQPHGSGLTDRTQDQLGSGGSNFDCFYSGIALVNGNRDSNTVTAIPGGGGAFAFTDLPIGDGWRVRFLNDARDWNDNPESPTGGTNALDIQGVMTHEYGHCLGLDHSMVQGASMGQTTTNRGVDLRSIEDDDIAGVTFLYGALDPNKPEIDTYTLLSGNRVRLEGARFDATDNEVWFTPINPLRPGDGTPVKVLGVPSLSGGTALEVDIPLGSGPGSIAIKIPGTTSVALSNVIPFDPAQEPWEAPSFYGTPGISDAGFPLEIDWRSIPSLTAGSFRLRVGGASNNTNFGIVVSGTMPNARSTQYGTLLVGGQLRREAIVPLFFGGGAIDVPLTQPAMVGTKRYYQVWAPDSGPGGGVFSNAIELEITQ